MSFSCPHSDEKFASPTHAVNRRVIDHAIKVWRSWITSLAPRCLRRWSYTYWSHRLALHSLFQCSHRRNHWPCPCKLLHWDRGPENNHQNLEIKQETFENTMDHGSTKKLARKASKELFATGWWSRVREDLTGFAVCSSEASAIAVAKVLVHQVIADARVLAGIRITLVHI